MKTMKHSGKKVLSVFLAALMVMTAWVFVEPTEAEASGSLNATQLAENNRAIIDTLTKPATVTLTGNLSTKVGRYNFYDDGDTDSVVNKYGTQSFVNVVYTPQVKSADDPAADFGMGKSQRADSVKVFYPETVMVVDGNNIPQMGVLLAADAYKNQSLRCISCWMSSGSNGLSFMSRNNRSEWYGKAEEDSCFYYTMWDAPDGYCLSSNGQNTDIKWGTGKGKWTFFANHLRFTGSFNANEWVRSIVPKWSFMGGSNDSSVYTASSTRKTIYVVNLKGYNDLIDTIFNDLQTVRNEAYKYKTESIEAYVNAIKGVINASPANYNFNGQGGSAATSWATAISNAKTAYDSAKNKTLATYTLTFEDINGNVKYTNTYNYGTAVNCESIAPANTGATQIAGDDSYHRLYKWNTDKYVTTIVDDVVINEISSGTQSHSYGEVTFVNANEHKSVCTVCGYEKVQAHASDAGRITKDPTCEETGVRTYKCTGCGVDFKTETVAAQGHSFTSKIYAEKEEGQNGTHYQKCIRCDKYGWGVTEGNCEAHKWQEDSRVNAECETDGLVTYKCTVCGSTSYTMTLTKTGHEKTTYHKGQAKSCGVKGWSEYWTCDKCGDVFTNSALTNEVDKTDADANGVPDAVEIPADAHVFNGQAVSVTQGKDGTHNYMCSNCGKAYGLDGVVDATEPHSWGEPEINDSSCTKEGLKKFTCTICNQTYTETIKVKPHQMTKIDAVEAKCGKAGNNEYYSCSTCGKYYKDLNGTTETTVADEVIPALVHKWTAHHDYDTLVSAATCMSKAVYNNHCDYCKIQLIGATHEYGEIDSVNGHQFNGEIKKNEDGTHSYKCTVSGCEVYGNPTSCEYEVIKDVASTCNTPGYTTYKCKDCGHGYSTEKACDPNNHTGEGTKIVGALDAKCNSNGYTGDTLCLGCGALLEKGTTITADPTVHPHENMQDYEGQAATCQNGGWKAYRYCSACRTYEIEKETIAKKDHKFTTYVSNNDGTHTAICDTCDATVAEPVTDTKDCSGGIANCVDKAVCTVCKTPYGVEDSSNHKTVVTIKRLASTCQTEGYEAYNHCNACDVDIDTIIPIAKKDHVYGSWSTNNDGTHSRSCTTCDAAVAEVSKETADCSGGVANCQDKAKCTICKAAYGDVDRNNHKTSATTLKNKKEATCTEKGYTGDKHYNCCDVVKEKGTEIPELEHNYTIEVEDSIVASTCTTKGSVDYKCETCDATENREINLDPQNHSSEETIVINKKDATCESDGYTGDIYHKCCYVEGGTNRYALISKGMVIDANGQHKYTTAVPEYMIEKIVEVKDDEGNVTSKSFDLKDKEPAYAEKIGYRHDDNYWYHAQICTVCYEVVYSRCYTYPDHQANCVNTDSCAVCSGLCSLINPDKHSLVEVEKISATCEKDGRKAYYECKICDKKFFDSAAKKEITDENQGQLKIPSTKKHTIDRNDTPEQAKDENGNIIPGKHAYGCSACGTAIIEACTGGTATCQNKAKCEYCGKEYGELNEDNHVEGTTIVESQEPDKCKPGVSGKTVYICCPKVVVDEGTVVPGKEPHTWVETTDKVDNCAHGYTITRKCSYCGETEITEVDAGIHDLSVVVYETEKDCTKDRAIYYACSICGFTDKEVVIDGVTYSYILVKEIDAAESCTWTSWKYEKKANCVVEGLRTRYCVVCGKEEEEIIPKTDHTIKTEHGYAATCDDAGKQDYVYCVIEGCPYVKGGAPIGQLEGYEKYKNCNGLVIEALGHGDHNGDDYCDHCGGFLHENEDGTNCNCVCHKRNAFMKLIYKILRFFWKLFGISRTCCSAGVHY